MTHEEFESLAALDAVGAATIEEEREINAHLEGCVPCRAVRSELMEAATLLARDLPEVAPPPALRGKVLGRVTPAEPIPIASHAKFRHWWLATAATLFLALWGWREMGIRTWREHASNQRAEIQQLRDQLNLLSARNEKLSGELSSLGSSDTRSIALAGQQISPAASARVFLEPGRRRAVVFFHNMPTNPVDKSYQLWIIQGNPATPKSAGVFDAPKNGDTSLTIENLPLDTEIKGLAVTMEPRGGVPQPTNKDFYVMGSS